MIKYEIQQLLIFITKFVQRIVDYICENISNICIKKLYTYQTYQRIGFPMLNRLRPHTEEDDSTE